MAYQGRAGALRRERFNKVMYRMLDQADLCSGTPSVPSRCILTNSQGVTGSYPRMDANASVEVDLPGSATARPFVSLGARKTKLSHGLA